MAIPEMHLWLMFWSAHNENSSTLTEKQGYWYVLLHNVAAVNSGGAIRTMLGVIEFWLLQQYIWIQCIVKIFPTKTHILFRLIFQENIAKMFHWTPDPFLTFLAFILYLCWISSSTFFSNSTQSLQSNLFSVVASKICTAVIRNWEFFCSCEGVHGKKCWLKRLIWSICWVSRKSEHNNIKSVR